jgi:RES domain-containing protein
VSDDPRRARDLRLLDQVDALPRSGLVSIVWRLVREGREPLQGGSSISRWCNGEFDVLYTSLERDGAIAELHDLLNLQPVFPSKIVFRVHRLKVSVRRALDLTDFSTLSKLGVDISRYQDRNYATMQSIADVAYFLGFDALLAPSARWPCINAVLFTDRVEPANLSVEATEPEPIDWMAWRRRVQAGQSRG